MIYKVRPAHKMAKPKQHLYSDKPYCDILGRNCCSKCNEGQLREASSVNSIADGENFISFHRERENNSPYSSLTSHTPPKLLDFREKVGWISRPAHSSVDDRKIEKLVQKMFPAIYKSLSAKSCGKPKDRKISNESEREFFFTTNRKLSARSFTPESLHDSLDSETCTMKRNCFDESEESGGKEKLCKLRDFARRQRQSSKCAINGVSEKEDDSCESIENQETAMREPSGQIINEVPWKVTAIGGTAASNINTSVKNKEKKSYQNRSRKKRDMFARVNKQDDRNQKNLPGGPFQMQVRRSFLAGETISTSAFEKLRVQVENWKPSLFESYSRLSARVSLKDYKTENLPVQTFVKENICQRQHGDFHPTNSGKPLLPFEPVMCEVKYMKNRWKDEALFNGNLFAMKLDA
eukprot:Seg3098.2 transcript_id=Seg3098.2/GoldUCD/mRNA.D3Y31 product="hypothetical protein" protein_id=Seg3098.2/GoldUCD/D3Y31